MHYIHTKEFYRYCLAARLALQGIEDFDQLDLAGACGQAAVLVSQHLLKRGIKTIVASGAYLKYHHYFSLVQHKETYLVDITATQFSRLIPPIIIGRLKDLSAYEIDEEVSIARMKDATLPMAKQKKIVEKIEKLLLIGEK
jgi:hypothetical protein